MRLHFYCKYANSLVFPYGRPDLSGCHLFSLKKYKQDILMAIDSSLSHDMNYIFRYDSEEESISNQDKLPKISWCCVEDIFHQHHYS